MAAAESKHFCTSKASKQTSLFFSFSLPFSWRRLARPRSRYFCTSKASTFVLVKQVNRVSTKARRLRGSHTSLPFFLPFSWLPVARPLPRALLRQYLYVCTSEACRNKGGCGWNDLFCALEWECKVGSGISMFCVSICTFVLVKHVGTKAAAGGMTFSVRASASVFVRSC